MRMNSKKTICRVDKTIADYSLAGRGDKVLVGFSGGPDSVALLHILSRLSRKLGIRLGAAYLNHLLRPRAAKKEARFCADFCSRLSVSFYYEEADVHVLAEKEKAGIEEIARRHRYRVLTALARDKGYNKVAVGHHRDDRVETILFNLFRGSGRQGIIGMPPKRQNIIRPLFDINREEIMEYLQVNNLAYMIDRSNLSRRFTRNRIRHKLIPLIRKEIADQAAENIIRFSDIMAGEEKFLYQKSHRLYRKVTSKTPGGKIRLDLTEFMGYDLWLKRRLAMQLLDEVGLWDAEYADVERALALAGRTGDSRLSVRKDLTAEKAGECLYLYHQGRRVKTCKTAVPGVFHLKHPRLWISFEYVDCYRVERVIESQGKVAYIDSDKLDGKLYVAGLKQGIRFHPYGRPGSKKAGDFLTDRKYPRPLRDELAVLYDGRGIVWLVGLEIDERVKVDKQTIKTVKLEVGNY
jgi:tRNA(Ile)-lysidine synthase